MLQIDCLDCGEFFEIEDFLHNSETSQIMTDLLEKFRRCPACLDAAEKRKNDAAAEEKIKGLPLSMQEYGFPPRYIYDRNTGALLTKPPVRFVAEWVWNRRYCNLLLSGKTGTGKTTSAAIVAQKQILSGTTFRYSSYSSILTLWRNARKADTDRTAELFRHLQATDCLIIDEVVGKARITESGQEFLFELLEQINNGKFRTKVWLLGNFYGGSLDELFADPEPAKRRIQENFRIGIINETAGFVEEKSVWP